MDQNDKFILTKWKFSYNFKISLLQKLCISSEEAVSPLKFLEYFNFRLATQLFPTGFICLKSEPHQGYHYNADMKYKMLLEEWA